ncbi:hypothetical protein SAMN05444337_2521 [Flavobacterium haoranii]|uniref:Uncharacterized protein n=1 Tax=Flavobacterium haoranii TaxID=683124 RepID=A0A1M6LTP5_9FLAO|nr:hypothetical protein SAMN05444337_2521 [Flavobacterium haoranii]
MIFSTNSSCQVTATLPLNSYDYPNGAYLKDINNQLPFYVGTWEGIQNNKQYTFQFTVFNQQMIDFGNGHYEYLDALVAKFKVVDLSSSEVLYDNLSAVNYDDYEIFLGSIQLGTFFCLDKNNCNNLAKFKLYKVTGTTNQLNYNDFRLVEFGSIDECPYTNQEDIPIFLPTGDFILTKQ